MQKTIYYFSGTGNSFHVAQRLAKEIGNCELLPISHMVHKKAVRSNNEIVGIVAPMYAFGLPDIVVECIKKMVVFNADYLFAVITCGAAKGGALYQTDVLLKKTGKRLSAGFYIEMPSNAVAFFDTYPESRQRKMLSESEREIGRIAGEIFKKKKNRQRDIFFVRNIMVLINSLWRKNLSKTSKNFFADSKCVSCGLCAEICPVSNIVIERNRPCWDDHCQNCMACINYCPKKAIQYTIKTSKRGRYHHPEVKAEDIAAQKYID